jgi:hypothetical protein
VEKLGSSVSPLIWAIYRLRRLAMGKPILREDREIGHRLQIERSFMTVAPRLCGFVEATAKSRTSCMA